MRVFYRVLFAWGSENRLPCHLLAFGLLVLQALFFNATLEDLKAFAESNYFPFFFYLLFAYLTFDTFHLAPFLLGQTFFLGALWLAAGVSKKDYDWVYIGIMMALATLFHQVFLLFNVFLIWYIRAVSMRGRFAKVVFFGYGFLAVWLATLLYFTAHQNVGNLVEQYFYVAGDSIYIDYDLNMIYLFVGLGLIILIMLLNVLINNHLRSKNLYFFILTVLIGLGFFSFRRVWTPSYFLLFALPFGYYWTSLGLAFRKKRVKIGWFYGAVLLILGCAYYNNNSVLKLRFKSKL